jgi:transposase-like protein
MDAGILFRGCWGALLMITSDVTCPKCRAGYRRIEVASGKRTMGEYRCLLCDHVLEVFDGSTEVAIRLTVQPARHLEEHGKK